MLKDIFIDNNIAKNFANPLDPEYKKLIRWLLKYDGDKLNDNAYLMLSNKLLHEYLRSTANASSQTNIAVIINKMTREGRIVKIDNKAIKEFKRTYFKPKIARNLTCNHEDRDHIPVVLLSDRKYALTLDNKFLTDLVNFPGFHVLASRKPQDLPYDQ